MILIGKYKPLISALVRYAVSGLIIGIAFMTISLSMRYILNVNIIISNISGFVLTQPFSFLLQKMFVFRSRYEWKIELVKSLIVGVCSLIVMLVLSVKFESFDSVLGVFIVCLSIPLINFFINALIFRYKLTTSKDTNL